jgi:hypothetical protein
MNKPTCLVCHQLYDSKHQLARHITLDHCITRKDYYDTYLRQPGEGFCAVCMKPTTFRGSRYLAHCSVGCYANNPVHRAQRSLRNKGRVQSEEAVKRRLKHTDQVAKEATRQATLTKKFGSLNTLSGLSAEQKAQRARQIKASAPRVHSKSHHKKVIQSKKRNGTLKHTPEARRRMSEAQKRSYQERDWAAPKQRKCAPYLGRGHKTAVVHGIYCLSSYEQDFVKEAFRRKIRLVSAATSTYRVPYIGDDGARHFYYPDFYLPDFNIMVEVKPGALLDAGSNPLKFDAAARFHENFTIVDEEALYSPYGFFQELAISYLYTKDESVNIFVLDTDPKIAATLHADKHVVKMILEYASMLSAAHHLNGSSFQYPQIYKLTHANHPCTQWVINSSANYRWLYNLLRALCAEYTYRYGRVHKLEREGVLANLKTLPKKFNTRRRTHFAMAMPEHLRCDDPVKAYRRYYAESKSHLLVWTGRPMPSFLKGYGFFQTLEEV